jgi:hypothetical protein
MVDSAVGVGQGSTPGEGVDSLSRVAFGGCPAGLVAVRAEDSPAHRWLAAVVLGGRGHYAAAAALLDRLYRDPSVPVALRAHAAVTRGAHLRQIGGHGTARIWDGRGLALASPVAGRAGPGVGGGLGDTLAEWCPGSDETGLDPAALGREGAFLDATVGLAADALGLGELSLAERLIRGVERPVLQHHSWRPSVRLSWVCAELALARGQSSAAAEWARRAVAQSRSAGALRHEIKSELVLTVALSTADTAVGTRDEAVNRLNVLFERVRRAQLGTLEWVIHMLLGSMYQVSDHDLAVLHRRLGVEVLRQIWLRTDPVGRRVFDRSPWVPSLVKN